ncbi:pantoate--beta-alanine ligase, partial [Bacillus mycoides]|uniref:pantoate--beta-alanine ligase n=1 Tax=Bacillus mycoides TaxID=1405 RepID=UPI003CC7EC3C
MLSLFLNPFQFPPNQHFHPYPTHIDTHQTLPKQPPVHYLFYPTVEQIYPPEHTTKVQLLKQTHVLCGKQRPLHF